jgi:DNA-binding XRE family transcriptional regulator
MVSRIKQLLDWQQLSSTQFADRIGVGRPVVSHILSERNKPSLEVVQRVIAAFPEISLAWLLSGNGPMLATEADAASVPSSETSFNNSASTSIPVDSASTLNTSEVPAAHPDELVAIEPLAQAAIAASPNLPGIRTVEPLAASIPVAVTESLPPTTPAPARFRASKPADQLAAPAAPAAMASLPTAATLSPEGSATVATTLGGNTTTSNNAAPEPKASGVTVIPSGTARPLPTDSVATATSAPQSAASNAAILAQGLAEPGKAIRRIVIFYRDGSFADYQPE